MSQSPLDCTSGTQERGQGHTAPHRPVGVAVGGQTLPGALVGKRWLGHEGPPRGPGRVVGGTAWWDTDAVRPSDTHSGTEHGPGQWDRGSWLWNLPPPPFGQDFRSPHNLANTHIHLHFYGLNQRELGRRPQTSAEKSDCRDKSPCLFLIKKLETETTAGTQGRFCQQKVKGGLPPARRT